MKVASSSRPARTRSFPCADGVGIAAVRDEREPVAAEREIALVRLHRGHDHALGQREEALVERPRLHARALDQMDDLPELSERIRPLPHLVEALADRALPLGGVRLDSCLAQDALVVVGARYLDLPGGEAMAEGDGPVAGDRLRVEPREPPAHRPRVAEPALVPAHRLREGEPAQDRVQTLGENVAQRLSRNGDPEKAVSFLELVGGNPVALRESRGAPSRAG